MYLTAQLAQWPQRPSALWNLPSKGYSNDHCLEFDFAVLEWWLWFEGKREEQKQVRQPKSQKLKDGHTWVRKYPTDQNILDIYYAKDGEEEALDPIVASMSNTDLDAFLEDWDDTARFDDTIGLDEE